MSSDFTDIFDVDWFVSFLSKDVKIIKQLPKRGGRTWSPYTMRVPRKCSERCYLNCVLPVLLKRHVSSLLKYFQSILYAWFLTGHMRVLDCFTRVSPVFVLAALSLLSSSFPQREKLMSNVLLKHARNL